MAKERDYLNVWFGEWGEYLIPDDVFALVQRFNKDGWPDRRFKGNEPFFAWVREQEEKARNG